MRPPKGGLAALLRALAGVLVVVGLSAAGLHGPEPTMVPDIPSLLAEQVERRVQLRGTNRPAFLPEADGPLSTASPPRPLLDPTLVSKVTQWGRRDIQYVVPDEALPFRYHVDRELAARFGIEVIEEAMSQWDGIPGSRWATELGSIVHHPERTHRRDGHSVVHLMPYCPPQYIGVALANTEPGAASLDLRYGAGALYTSQVDIGICPHIDSDEHVRGVIAHEVGHLMGMAHLCEPGEVCWDRATFGHDHRCRPMFYTWGPCREGVTYEDHDAARHLYPTLPRLHGPTPVETASRASYATTWTGTADTVVLARADGTIGPVLAAALGGALGAPVLLGLPDPRRCVVRAAAEELARAASRSATVVLVGSWPGVCTSYLGAWDLEVAQTGAELPDADGLGRAVALSVELAGLVVDAVDTVEEPVSEALVMPLRGDRESLLDGVVAAAAAARRGAPLLLTDPDELSPEVAQWLLDHPQVERVTVAGGPRALATHARLRIGRLGKRVGQLSVGEDPVSRAALLASAEAPSVFDETGPVVVAPTGSVAEAAIGAAVAGRLSAPLLLSPDDAHPSVIGWLARHRPHGGYLVGSTDVMPYPLQRQYTRFVEHGDEPVPSRRDQPRGLLQRAGLRD